MNDVEIKLSVKPSFVEVWFEGSVTFKDKEHKFWLVDPQGVDENGHSYYYEVRWFFKQVPMEVRLMSESIISAFLQMQNKTPLN